MNSGVYCISSADLGELRSRLVISETMRTLNANTSCEL